RPPAQIDLVVGEEGARVALPLRADQPRDALEHARVGAFGILARHGLPVLLHEVPREAAPVHAAEEAADHVRRVLAPNLPVERHLQRAGEELRRAEAGEGVEIALLLLRRAGALEALAELRVFGLAPGRGHDGDHGREDVGLHRGLVLPIAGVDFAGPRLDLRIVAKGADGAKEIATELAGELALALLDLPAPGGGLLTAAAPGQGGEPAPPLGRDPALDAGG